VGDRFFNRLAKASVDYSHDADVIAARFRGVRVDTVIQTRETADDESIRGLLAGNGIAARVSDGGRVHVTGDLGRITEVARADARLAFRNEFTELGGSTGRQGRRRYTAGGLCSTV